MSASIALGPAPHSWGKEKLLEFYSEEVPSLGVESVYIGDHVCSRRNALKPKELKPIIADLKSKGMKVFLSTLALATTKEDSESILDLYDIFDGIEANMIGYLNLLKRPELQGKNKELILGSYLNIYNWRSASFLKKYNPTRLVPAHELPLESVADMAEKSGIPIEMPVWGRVSTALSWRCYTARATDKNREECAMVCLDHPEGMLLKSIEEEDLFMVDGAQVLSARINCLVEHLVTLQNSGVKYLRIVPDMDHTTDIVNIFQKVLAKKLDPKSGLNKLEKYAPQGLCNGWLWGKPGWEYVAAVA